MKSMNRLWLLIYAIRLSDNHLEAKDTNIETLRLPSGGVATAIKKLFSGEGEGISRNQFPPQPLPPPPLPPKKKNG